MSLMAAGAAAWRRGGSGPTPPPPVLTPVVKGAVATPGLGTGTSFNALISAPAAGDLVICVIQARQGGTGNPSSMSTSAGGTFLNGSGGTAFSNVRTWIWYKIADGGEGSSIPFSMNQTNIKAIVSYTIEAGTFRADGDFIEYQVASASSTNPTPPTLTPSWGEAYCLWIAAAQKHSNNISNFPLPDNQISALSGTSGTAFCFNAMCSTNLLADSLTPGSFTGENSLPWIAETIAIRPAAA